MASLAWANKSSVGLEAPEKANKGDTVQITIHVRHDGNNFFHYTDWVSLQINGQEVEMWEYSMLNRPEEENFTIIYKYPVQKTTEIQAQAHCNRHGSDNTAKAVIDVQ
jgi:desulfoferrodoxin (superoxide reductase-like protein)